MQPELLTLTGATLLGTSVRTTNPTSSSVLLPSSTSTSTPTPTPTPSSLSLSSSARNFSSPQQQGQQQQQHKIQHQQHQHSAGCNNPDHSHDHIHTGTTSVNSPTSTSAMVNHQHQHQHQQHVGYINNYNYKQQAYELVSRYIENENALYQVVTGLVKMSPYELFQEVVELWIVHAKQVRVQQQQEKQQEKNKIEVEKVEKEKETKGEVEDESSSNNDDPVLTLLQRYDPTSTNHQQYTLLHWASKRVDDVRFVQFILERLPWPIIDNCNDNDTNNATKNKSTDPKIEQSNSYPTPVHRPSRDTTAMTPLHWACTMPDALPIIKVLLSFETRMMNNNSSNSSSIGKRSTGSTSSLQVLPKKLVEIRDGSGCTPLLLAAQHGQVETVAYLLQCCKANLFAVDTSLDGAVHWASYKGCAQVLGLLTYYHNQYYYTQQHQQQHNNTTSTFPTSNQSQQQQHPFLTPDAYGQTPLHLAALRGHTSACRYILQQLLLFDDNSNNNNNHNNNYSNDITNSRNKKDKKQIQKKNYRIVKEILSMKDTNGRTPYELAIHKEKAIVATVLKQMEDEIIDHNNYYYYFYNNNTNNNSSNNSSSGTISINTISNNKQKSRWLWYRYWLIRLTKLVGSTMKSFVSIHSWKLWLGITTTSDIDEYDVSPQFPVYYVYFQALLHLSFVCYVFMPFHNPEHGLLWDCVGTFLCSLSFMIATMISLYYTMTTDPGSLSASASASSWKNDNNNKNSSSGHNKNSSKNKNNTNDDDYDDDDDGINIELWKRLYGETLEQLAESSTSTKPKYSLCHTCHVAKPYRSKHCKIQRSCVVVFDHHCPFVNSTIGLYNYRYFYSFLTCMTLYFVSYWIMFGLYWIRTASASTVVVVAATAAETTKTAFEVASTNGSSSIINNPNNIIGSTDHTNYHHDHDQHSTFSYGTIFFGLFLGLHILFPAGMLFFHTQLVYMNLTTNEQIHLGRYEYLWRTTSSSSSSSSPLGNNRYYYNPWDKGFVQNFINRIIAPRSDTCYLIPEEQERLLTNPV